MYTTYDKLMIFRSVEDLICPLPPLLLVKSTHVGGAPLLYNRDWLIMIIMVKVDILLYPCYVSSFLRLSKMAINAFLLSMN